MSNKNTSRRVAATATRQSPDIAVIVLTAASQQLQPFLGQTSTALPVIQA